MADNILNKITAYTGEFETSLDNAIMGTLTLIQDGVHMAEHLYNSTSTRFLELITDTPAEYWLLHPMGRFVTVCLAVMVYSFTMAFRLGLMHDIKDGWAWVKRQIHRLTGFARAEVEEPQHEHHDKGDKKDDDKDDEKMSVHNDNRAASVSVGYDEPSYNHLAIPTTGTFSAPASHFDHPDSTSDFAPAPFSSSSTTEHRTGRPSTPGHQTLFANANVKAFASSSSFTMNKSVLQKEGLFNSDATLSRAAGKKFLGRKWEGEREEGRAEFLALDGEERERLRRSALGKMKKEEEEEEDL